MQYHLKRLRGRRDDRGFTLLEMVIALSLLSIVLAATSSPDFTQKR